MPINQTSLDVNSLIGPDGIAVSIAEKWTAWDGLRATWKERQLELRNYLYATDTTTTSNKTLPWTNSTTIPKLTQIYENLKANYTAALFPRADWLSWVPFDNSGANVQKAKVAKEYIRNKIEHQKFEETADRLLDDYIMGNCFATVEWVEEGHLINEGTPLEEYVVRYRGPKVVRISPYDIVFNPTASTFKESPKIIRSLVSLSHLKKLGISEELYAKLEHNRGMINGISGDSQKARAFVADGFSDIKTYYQSGYVEILTFYGDLWDIHEGRLRENRKITVVDRAYVLSDEPISSWLGESPVFHIGWRSRPDNLYGMSPLENLVGMQYRIDHLENLKADVFDMIALPMLLVKGDVEDFDYEPGERIILGDDGEVGYLRPEVSALSADNQMMLIANTMEDFAGAPKQAMGIRTPGEKTAFEVQTLNDNASRVFQHKTAKFEREFLEPILNAMLASARENLDSVDTIGVFQDEVQTEIFQSITKSDIATNGIIRPVGARNFAEKQRRAQELSTLIQLKQDPSIGIHLSGKRIAKMLAEEIGQETLFEENVAIKEQMDTQRVAQDAEVDMFEELSVKQELGE